VIVNPTASFSVLRHFHIDSNPELYSSCVNYQLKREREGEKITVLSPPDDLDYGPLIRATQGSAW